MPRVASARSSSGARGPLLAVGTLMCCPIFTAYCRRTERTCLAADAPKSGRNPHEIDSGRLLVKNAIVWLINSLELLRCSNQQPIKVSRPICTSPRRTAESLTRITILHGSGLKTTYYLRAQSATHVEKSTLKRTDAKLNAVANPVLLSSSIEGKACWRPSTRRRQGDDQLPRRRQSVAAAEVPMCGRNIFPASSDECSRPAGCTDTARRYRLCCCGDRI